MKNISFLKKISLYWDYRKVVLDNRKELQTRFNLRLDRVNRIYTVVNVPTELFEEPYNLRSQDINKIAEPYMSEYIRQISGTLNERGLNELYKLYSVEKVDKYSYLVIIGFSLFDTDKMARNFLFKVLPISIVISALSALFFL